MSSTSVLDKIKLVLKAILAAFGGVSALAFLRYLVFLIQYKIKQNRKHLPLAPGPTPLPIVGSLLSVAKNPGPDGNPLIHVNLMEMGKKYNGLFGMYLGAQYHIVLTKPCVAEEAYCEHELPNGEKGRGANCVDRASLQSRGGQLVPTIHTMTRGGQGIAMSYGAYWRKVRGRLVAHITNPIVAEKNAPMIMEEVNSVCWAWRQKCLRGEPLDDLTAQLKRESMNMGYRLLFSHRYGAELTPDFQTLQYCVEYCFQNISAGHPSDLIPFLRMFPNKFLQEFKEVCDRRDKVLGRIVKQHREEFDELKRQGKMNKRSDSRDICDLFFWDQDEGYEVTEDGKTRREYLTEDQVHVCMWDIMFALTDTTATTNEYLIYHMINNPDIQQKVHEELDRVIGPDRVPTIEDRENLPYLWSVLREVFRYRIVSPLSALHYAIDDMTLHDETGKEFFVPAGTCIMLHGYAMALDPELWDEPEKFNPDRWMPGGREEGLDVYGQNRRRSTDDYKFIPFSIGPRMCPGYSFAKVAQFIQSATIMHSFRFSLTQGAEKRYPDLIKNSQLDMTENWGITIMPRRYGDMGVVKADPRPVSRLFKPLWNDIDPSNTFLEGKIEKKIKLAVREQLSADTVLLRFVLGGKNQVLGLPVGKHIKVIVPNVVGVEPGKWNGRDDPEASQQVVQRAYTPTSSDKDIGYIDLLVKIYSPKMVARFPDGGKVSHQLGNLAIGDEITISGPWGLIEYQGRSQFKIGRNLVTKKYVGMMAGGSGITPMLQILRAALEDPEDATKFSLIYANQTEQDILCRETLEDLEQRFPSRFRLHYTIDRPPADGSWKYSVGFIDGPMIAEHMPPKGDDTIIFGCGPPAMLEFACKKNLEKLGYSKEHFAVF